MQDYQGLKKPIYGLFLLSMLFASTASFSSDHATLHGDHTIGVDVNAKAAPPPIPKDVVPATQAKQDVVLDGKKTPFKCRFHNASSCIKEPHYMSEKDQGCAGDTSNCKVFYCETHCMKDDGDSLGAYCTDCKSDAYKDYALTRKVALRKKLFAARLKVQEWAKNKKTKMVAMKDHGVTEGKNLKNSLKEKFSNFKNKFWKKSPDNQMITEEGPKSTEDAITSQSPASMESTNSVTPAHKKGAQLSGHQELTQRLEKRKSIVDAQIANNASAA